MPDNANTFDQNTVYTQIIDSLDYVERFPLALCSPHNNRQAEQGQFVIAGQGSAPLLSRIGYVVQVRINQGQFGSDIYLLRHSDGSLMQHANNHYIPMTVDEVNTVRPFFGDALPEQENYARGYSLGDEASHAVGFMIEPPEGFQSRGGEGARMRVTTTNANGTTSVHDTVFL